MRKTILLLILVVTLAASMSVFAGRLRYTVDPATVFPQDATVITRGNGHGPTVVIFEVPVIEEGMEMSFRLDLTARAGDDTVFPVTGDLQNRGRRSFDTLFDPAQITFNADDQTVSSNVTLTVPEGDYTRTRKLKAKIHATFPDGTEMGGGSGVIVYIVAVGGESQPADDFDEGFIEALAPSVPNQAPWRED